MLITVRQPDRGITNQLAQPLVLKLAADGVADTETCRVRAVLCSTFYK